MAESTIKETEKEGRERQRNFNWLASQNLTEFSGQWVSVVNRKIVAYGPELKLVMKETKRQYPDVVPYITLVPTHETFIA